MNNNLHYQLAQPIDAKRIAELFRISAEGYADYTWSLISRAGENLLDVGEARFSREGTEFSYQNCITVREGHNVIGMLHSYPIYSLQEGETPPSIEATDPVFMPFKALEEPG